MSIDLSRVTGISDSRGAFTEIKDSLGRVIWSATPPFDGIIYLRPSADISVDSTITLTPADATAAYMLINEEVSDGAATEIKISSSSTVSGTAAFSLAGKTPNTISRVTNIRLCVSGAGTNVTNKYCICSASIAMDATTYSYRIPAQSLVNYEVLDATANSANEELLTKINDYVTENGILPNLDLSLYLGLDKSESDSGKDAMTMSISQVYVVIECE